eukprot:NODE_6025_length_937_cov_1.133907_g5437_i0.p1 GENE.NODE_6025_length_937_cov_1.133907_g5437_i0~~NODE_6025_length_937_cov_1.133907_g5437_i0.p1  ORF type:complete len:166 (+),score=33.13 NODE_6025_length_937_cov_1.133907_g5437_i0:235-732(+)
MCKKKPREEFSEQLLMAVEQDTEELRIQDDTQKLVSSLVGHLCRHFNTSKRILSRHIQLQNYLSMQRPKFGHMPPVRINSPALRNSSPIPNKPKGRSTPLLGPIETNNGSNNSSSPNPSRFAERVPPVPLSMVRRQTTPITNIHQQTRTNTFFKEPDEPDKKGRK